MALHGLLSPRFELKSHVGLDLADDARRIDLLTNEQFTVLDSLEDNPQMSISGSAGSGRLDGCTPQNSAPPGMM